MAEPIDMPFGLKTRVDPGNHVLDEGPDPPWEESIWRGIGGRPIVKYGSKKAPIQSCSSGGANCAHMGRHIGTT